MPDRDPDSADMMDAPGTRVTPDADVDLAGGAERHGRAGRGPDAPAPDAFAGHGRAGDTGAAAPAGIGIGADDGALAAAPADPGPAAQDPAHAHDNPDVAAAEGGTGTSGSRGGGPAADFSDDPAPARGGDASRG